MSDIVKLEPQLSVIQFTDEQLTLIKNTVAKEATNDELALFIHVCKQRGLDPLAKQIYFQKRKNNKNGKSDIVFITSIDGNRLIADRTGKYAGNDDPIFDNEEKPSRATVTVYKMISGVRCPFTATARWDQYCPEYGRDFMWKKMPHLMLGKVAESLALRKAFPAELSGVYTNEEMDQAQNSAATIPAETSPQAAHEVETNIEKLLLAFEKIGIDQLELERFLGKSLIVMTPEDVEQLRSFYQQHKSEKEDQERINAHRE